MDEIINKLDSLYNLSQLLDDNDKIEFDKKNQIAIDRINILLLDIENDLITYNISEEKINEFNDNKDRTHHISKILFPIYWNLAHQP
jgi:hypothetical protein